MTTAAPCRASANAVARPIPEPPPVITATLSFNMGIPLVAGSKFMRGFMVVLPLVGTMISGRRRH